MSKGMHYLGDPQVERAVQELTTLVASRYPDAEFVVNEGEDPDGVYIIATVDVEDPDEITDLVIERMMELQIDEHVPVYVIPIRPIARTIASRRQREHGEGAPAYGR